MSEVRAKLISDLRRLTSVTDDFSSFYGFYDLNGSNDLNPPASPEGEADGGQAT